MKRLVVAAAAVLVACADAGPVSPLLTPSVPRFAVDVNETTPVVIPTVNPCTGETVVLEGTQHFVLRTTTRPDGSMSYGTSIDQNLSGVGSLGSSYTARLTFSDQGVINAPFPIILYTSGTTRVTSTGKLGGRQQNWAATYSFRIVFNALGVPTVERIGTVERCSGKSTTV